MEAFLEGAAILGTGGGGSPEWGRKILTNDFEKGRECYLVDPDDIEDDAFIVCGGIMGSVKTLEEMEFYEILSIWEENFPLEKVLNEMEKEVGKKINYLVPFEMGCLNVPVMLTAGARLGIPVVDGDALGRAAPETQMTSFIGHGISLTPMVLIDRDGNLVVVKESVAITYPDELGRWVVTRGGGLGANSHYPMSGKQLKKSVIPRTISKAIEIGKKVILARKSNRDPLEEFAKFTGAIKIFNGKITDIEQKLAEGFYFTEVKLEGINSDKGSTGKLTVKNETMAFWKNNDLKILFPDLLCILEPETCRGLMSVELKRT